LNIAAFFNTIRTGILMTPDQIESLVDKKVKEHTEPLREKLDDIYKLLAKFEGAGTVMKLLFLGVAPIVAALAWLKDHVKF
jgi:hypothetical protein